MRTLSSPSGIRKMIAPLRRKGLKIALVPTMGALHEGHLRLVDLARRHSDLVVMSIYVNPSQFGPMEDFSRYPRPLKRDKALASGRGVDVLFHPATLYNPDDSVNVHEKELSQGRCGASRPGHFDGVVTVVSKLFNIVQPDVAIFGQKDGQQLDVIERLVRDLYFPVRIIRAPIVRDKNGVALSSRNQYLSATEYARAVQFAAALKGAVRQSDSVQVLNASLKEISGLKVDYTECSGGRLYVAVKIGKTRLIDNRKLPNARGSRA